MPPSQPHLAPSNIALVEKGRQAGDKTYVFGAAL